MIFASSVTPHGLGPFTPYAINKQLEPNDFLSVCQLQLTFKKRLEEKMNISFQSLLYFMLF